MRILSAIVLLVTLAWAVRPYARCPIDGEEAAYEGRQDGKQCQYRHVWTGHQDANGSPIVHEFWADCD